MRGIVDIINDFNDGETEFVEDNYGGVINFFKVLKKKNLLHLIDFNNIDPYAENEALLFLFESDKETFKKNVLKKLDDVVLIDNEPYVELGRLGDLSVLFCGRNISQDSIQLILDGDYDSGWYYSEFGIYDDIITNLNLKNIGLLKNYMIENLKGVEIYPGTEVLFDISEEQNTDFVLVTEENIDFILKDAKSIEFIIETHLEDLDSNLRMIADSAYRDAYYHESTNLLLNSLSNYFDPDYKTNKYFLLKIVDFWDYIVLFLKENLGWQTTLNYYGSYLEVLKVTIECIRIYLPDYPDSRLTDKFINDMIPDYI